MEQSVSWDNQQEDSGIMLGSTQRDMAKKKCNNVI
jgi:hypothetical protein